MLSGTNIADKGLVHLQHVPQLPNLQLSRTAITDQGPAKLKSLPHLKVLLLDGTQITDAGLVHLRELRELQVLDLSNTTVGDAGLAQLKVLTQLDVLRLTNTRITDTGLASLQPLKRLEDIDLDDTTITGDGFARLSDCERLTRLYLDNTQLNDAGMANLRNFPLLIVLNIKNTPASDAAVEALRKALPDLMIDGDSYHHLHGDSSDYEELGVRDSEAPNYLLAQWIRLGNDGPPISTLSPRMEAALKNDTRELLDVHDIHLSQSVRLQLSRLRRVRWLRLSTETTANDLTWIGELTQLRGLSFRGANLNGANFQSLAALTSLQWLDLSDAKIIGSDFATLPNLPKLQTLYLNGKNVTDEHLLHLAKLRLSLLATLSLTSTSVSDRGLASLCGQYNLVHLSLYFCRNITAQSVDALGQMTNLRKLGICLTGLSPNYNWTPAVDRLCKLLPDCEVIYLD